MKITDFVDFNVRATVGIWESGLKEEVGMVVRMLEVILNKHICMYSRIKALCKVGSITM